MTPRSFARIAFVLFAILWLQVVAHEPGVAGAFAEEAQVIASDVQLIADDASAPIILDGARDHLPQHRSVEFWNGVMCELATPTADGRPTVLQPASCVTVAPELGP